MHPDTEKKLTAALEAARAAIATARDVVVDEVPPPTDDDESATFALDALEEALEHVGRARGWLLPTREEDRAVTEWLESDPAQAEDAALDEAEAMDGDAESALASAGLGTDEDYGGCGDDW